MVGLRSIAYLRGVGLSGLWWGFLKLSSSSSEPRLRIVGSKSSASCTGPPGGLGFRV